MLPAAAAAAACCTMAAGYAIGLRAAHVLQRARHKAQGSAVVCLGPLQRRCGPADGSVHAWRYPSPTIQCFTRVSLGPQGVYCKESPRATTAPGHSRQCTRVPRAESRIAGPDGLSNTEAWQALGPEHSGSATSDPAGGAKTFSAVPPPSGRITCRSPAPAPHCRQLPRHRRHQATRRLTGRLVID